MPVRNGSRRLRRQVFSYADFSQLCWSSNTDPSLTIPILAWGASSVWAVLRAGSPGEAAAGLRAHTGGPRSRRNARQTPRGPGSRAAAVPCGYGRVGGVGAQGAVGRETALGRPHPARVAGPQDAPRTFCSPLSFQGKPSWVEGRRVCATLRIPPARSRAPSRALPGGRGGSSQPSGPGRECQPAVGGGPARAVASEAPAGSGRSWPGGQDREGETERRGPGVRSHRGRGLDKPIPRGSGEGRLSSPHRCDVVLPRPGVHDARNQ